MSADMLITALLIDEGREPDFEAADLVAATLASCDVIEPDRFADHDPDAADDLRQIRSTVRSDLRSLQRALAESSEVREMTVRRMKVYLTGGLSWGDGPTEVWDVIARLRAVRGVLTAAGFEDEE